MTHEKLLGLLWEIGLNWSFYYRNEVYPQEGSTYALGHYALIDVSCSVKYLANW